MDEQALIKAAMEGDIDSFNTLVLTYQSQVYNFAYHIMGDSDSAADATQEAFISAYRALRGYRGGSFRSWLLRIVTNACYDEMRRRKRRPVSSLDALYIEDPTPDAEVFVSKQESPESSAARHELDQAIQAGIAELPEDQRVTLVLSDVQGMSYEEIAEVTSTNLGTVKSRLSRARAKLRDYLQTQGELLPSAYRLQSNSA